jgi:hypothetical protein
MKYLSMFSLKVAAMISITCLRRSLLRKEALKYPWFSIYIHETMMKGRNWNLQGMESIEDSMDPRAKEKQEEEHEDSKKEIKSTTIS